MRDSFDITYAAYTNSCTFLLDSEGVCRRIVPSPGLKRTPKGRDAATAATRCVGAQYVASLDASLPGMLAEMPRVGIPMIFARVDERGRVSLVRTGVVTRFESQRADDPFSDRAPSVSVETSAPVIPPSKSNPRRPRETLVRERASSRDATRAVEADVNLAKTAEYEAGPDRRADWRGERADLGTPTTVRRAIASVPPQSEPRRSEAYAMRSRERAVRHAEPPRTPYPGLDQTVSRRPGGR
ncbi:MAG TPA: hypothetical protein VM925_08065 [Labilithrix sp.]|nr:hypothetical protein [Labilithrix sp.]